MCNWCKAQHAIKPTIYIVNSKNAKITKLKFGKEYTFFLRTEAASKMGLSHGFNGYLLKPVLQVGDTLVFKEGRLAISEVDSIFAMPAIAKFVYPTIMVMGVTMVLLNQRIDPTRKIWFTMLIIPVVGTIHLFTYLAKPKVIKLNQYQLIPQNIHGKPPLNGW
jgi:hypothetical protein